MRSDLAVKWLSLISTQRQINEYNSCKCLHVTLLSSNIATCVCVCSGGEGGGEDRRDSNI